MSLIDQIKEALRAEEILCNDHWIFDEAWVAPAQESVQPPHSTQSSQLSQINQHSRLQVNRPSGHTPTPTPQPANNPSQEIKPLTANQKFMNKFNSNQEESAKRKGLGDIKVPKPVKPNFEDDTKIQSATNLEEFNHLLFEHPWYKNLQQHSPKIGKVNLLAGQGPINPQLMIINLQPYPDDIQLGYPFSGAPGDLLKKMLKAIGIEKNLSYQTFLDHSFSAKKLLPRDRIFLLEILKKEIELVQPKVILIFSEELAQTALNVRNLEAVISTELKLLNIPTVATYPLHWMLHDEGWKRPAWTTLQTLKAILEES